MLTQYVGIKSHHSKYLTSSSGGKLVCDKNEMKDNEVFTIRQESSYNNKDKIWKIYNSYFKW